MDKRITLLLGLYLEGHHPLPHMLHLDPWQQLVTVPTQVPSRASHVARGLSL